ncbi:hypothetical protein LM602_00745 [Candidatus Acetothermia bacterium]|jgi:hypothetical protein|nr:hypothetical protein [Candidatus Acetothermia bacterium]MCI2431075.1 hypothetical protein [Candidatus Acetothermia bacterium]MCI2435699.1 hypothetical protein [Candidatus Acetothermia bacterium]
MRSFLVLLVLVAVMGVSVAVLAEERFGRVGLVLSWMELNNFQPALPSIDLEQRAMLFSLRAAMGSDAGLSLRLAVGWGMGFAAQAVALAHFESAIAWGVLSDRLRIYAEAGMGMLQIRQGVTEAWRLTGWVAGGGQMRFLLGSLIFFEIAPLTLLDFNAPSIPWVWFYRTGALWQF